MFDYLELIKQSNKLYNLIDSPPLIYPDGHLSVMLFFYNQWVSHHLFIIDREGKMHYQYKNFSYRKNSKNWAFVLLNISTLLSDFQARLFFIKDWFADFYFTKCNICR